MKSPQLQLPAGPSNHVILIGWALTFAGLLTSHCSQSKDPSPIPPPPPATIEICFVMDEKMLPNGFAVQGPGTGSLAVVGGRVHVSRRWEGETMRLLNADESVVHQFVLSCGSSSSVEVTVPTKALSKEPVH